jgi:hypothetical protein
MSRVRTISTSLASLGLIGVMVLTGCSNSSAPAAASASPAASSAASTAASPAASSAASSAASAAASELAADPSPIPSNLTKAAFCLLTAPLYDKAALPSSSTNSETGVLLAAKRLIKGTQALSRAERLKALTGKQVAEIQVTMAILLTLLQDPTLEKGTVEQMSKASGVDTKTLQIAQTQAFKDESVAAFKDLATFCA